ncbi:TcdA/TcdB pore-forming domain-containing protein [Paludibacterium yongneupense]|uniref:TcdA/TcdB pore-forming domain-containing protein n=1 Tax=Paludibacterium yongneupense TaxID=400061 RepID=UPI00040A542B|nr:TcdA/TcdB pore-forming domain-containing protein [Paludibacterium yongneupense]
MLTLTLYPHSLLHFLWTVIVELSAGGNFTQSALRTRLHHISRQERDPGRRRWAKVTLLLPNLRGHLRRMEQMHLLHSRRTPFFASGKRNVLEWQMQPTTRVLVAESVLLPGEELQFIEAFHSLARQRTPHQVGTLEAEALAKHVRRLCGGEASDEAARSILFELVRSDLLLRVHYGGYQQDTRSDFVLQAVGQRLLEQWQCSRIAPRSEAHLAATWFAPGAAPLPSTVPGAPLIPQALAAATADSLVQLELGPAIDEAELWAHLQAAVASAANQFGDERERLLNDTICHLLMQTSGTEEEPEQAGSSHQGRSPFLAPEFAHSILRHLLNTLHDGAQSSRSLLGQQLAARPVVSAGDLQRAATPIVARMAARSGLPAEAVNQQTLSALAASPVGRQEADALEVLPHSLVESLLADYHDSGAEAIDPQAALQRVLVLEIEPLLPNPEVALAAERRMRLYLPAADRYRLRRNGLWQYWQDRQWLPAERPGLAPGIPLKLVVVGEGQSLSEREDSSRVSGLFGDELGAFIAELLPAGCDVQRLSLLACRPGLGFVQTLLETLHIAGINVIDVVRRRGKVLLTEFGRAWVSVGSPPHWQHGPGTREVVSLDPVSMALLVRPDPLPGIDATLDAPPLDSAGPLGSLLPPDDVVFDHRLEGGRMRELLARLTREAGLDSGWLPLFKSLRTRADGSSALRLLHPASGRTHDLVTDDPLLPAFVSRLDTRLTALQASGHGDYHTLGHVFSYGLGLATLLSQPEQPVGADDPLGNAIRLHAELGRVQFTHGALNDIAALTRQAHALLDGGRALAPNSRLAQTVYGGLELANRGLGPALGLASFSFDIYELMHAMTPADKALFATQLGFDGSATLIEAGALLAARLGAAAIAEAAGPIGLAIALLGFTVQTFMQILQRQQALLAAEEAVEDYFARMAAAHRDGGCKHHADTDTLEPSPGCVITLLDLEQGRIEFGDHLLMASELFDSTYIDSAIAGENQTLYTLEPRMIDDPSRALPLRERLGFASSLALNAPRARHVVLPATPGSLIRYRYQRLRKPYQRAPQAVRNHPGYAVMQGLAQGGGFFFDNDGVAMVDLDFEYRDTPIEVRLDASARTLLSPPLAPALAKHLSYTLFGAGGHYLLTLTSATAGYRLHSRGEAPSHWMLDVDAALDGAITAIATGGFRIGSIPIAVQTAADSVSVRQANGEIYRVDRSEGRCRLLALDAGRLVPPARSNAALLAVLAARSDCADVVVIENAPGRLFYHRASQRLLQPGADSRALDAELLWIDSDSAFFIDRTRPSLWHSGDDGMVKARLRFLFEGDDARLTQVQHQEGGALIEQHIGPGTPGLTLLYHFDAARASLTLTGVHCALEAPAMRGETAWRQWLERAAGRHDAGHEDEPLAGVTARAAQFAPWVALYPPSASPPAWRRSRDGFILRPRAGDGQTLPTDLMLIPPPDEATGENRFFHSTSERALYRQNGEAAAVRLPLPPTRSVSSIDGCPVLCDDTGVLHRLGDDGSTHLLAVNRTWFEAHRSDWWHALVALSGDEPARHEAIIALPALRDGENRTRNAWYDSLRRCFVIAPAALADVETRLIGVDAGALAWLFDASAGKIYAQAPLAPELLPALFDPQGRLLGDAALAATPVLVNENIVSATLVAGHLHALNTEGAVLGIDHYGRARLLAVDRSWPAIHAPDRQRRAALQALTARYPHPEVIRLDGARPAWYRRQSDSLITSMLARDPVFIGNSTAGDVAYYFDRADGVMRSCDRNRNSRTEGLYRDACRVGDWLFLRGQGPDTLHLPLLDGVERIWLGGDGDADYRIDEGAWRHFRRIVLDDHAFDGRSSSLALDFEGAAGLAIVARDDDLLLRAHDNGRQIELRQALRASGERRRQLSLQVAGLAASVSLARLARPDFDRSGRLTLAQAQTLK